MKAKLVFENGHEIDFVVSPTILRQVQGETIRETSYRAGIKHETFSNYEKGYSKPSFDNIRAYAKALKVPAEMLFELLGEMHDA